VTDRDPAESLAAEDACRIAVNTGSDLCRGSRPRIEKLERSEFAWGYEPGDGVFGDPDLMPYEPTILELESARGAGIPLEWRL
jgi:hypothetical protein